jgi:hypothetical protein
MGMLVVIMSNEIDLLKRQISELQKEYKSLLETLSKTIDSDLKLSLDAIEIFWYKNKDLVIFFIENFYEAYECVMFTAGTYLNIDKNEHYPLLTFGKVHIIDDPVLSYIQMLKLPINEKYQKHLADIIKIAINNNIKAIDNYSENILVLPIRYIFSLKYGEVQTQSTQIFLDQFNSIKTMPEFFELKSYEDISSSLRKGVEKALLFFENDDGNKTLKERLENFIQDGGENIPDHFKKSPAAIFYGSVFSRISQAVDVFRTCYSSKIVPLIRDKMAIYYLIVLSEQVMKKDNDYMLFKNRVNICFSYNRMFEYFNNKNIPISEYINQLKESKIVQFWYDKKEVSLTLARQTSEEILNIIYKDNK